MYHANPTSHISHITDITTNRIEPSTRLRRAIHLNDASLVSRLLRSHPALLSNPDFSSKANTSLHLAASHGFTTIATLLIDAGHDADEISRNADHNTPLMLAAQAGHVETATLLAVRFPRSIHYRNKDGLDALALATQNTASTGLIPTLLSGHGIYYADVESRDNEGNTPLHHASASGGLKALRLLLDAGADPTARNFYDWMPVAYSQTVAAEVYFRNLVAEYERRKMIEAEQRESGKVGIRAGAVRLVMDDDGSGGTAEDDVLGKQAWSPSGERRRPPTPPGVRGGGDWAAATIALVRTRSGSGGQ